MLSEKSKHSYVASDARSIAQGSEASFAKKMKQASTYSKTSEKVHSETQSRLGSAVAPNDYNAADYRMQRNDLYGNNDASAGKNMHLVPCRWQRNGWKYVEADPAKHNFFNNPNRINSMGISPKQREKITKHYGERP